MLQNIIILSFCFTLGVFTAQAQQHKEETKGAKKITITELFGKINIEETTGSQLIIDVENLEDIEIPEKAKGLKPLSPNGVDNTGLALNIENSGSEIKITGATKKSIDGKYLIKIPKGISVVIEYQSPFTSGNIDVDGFSSELEISTLNEDINLNNVTGPLVLNTINGDVNIDFSAVNQSSPISISAINGEIDIKMPANTPANLKLGTMHGEIYTNFDVQFDKSDKDGLTHIGGGHETEGTINNGGVEITLQSINANIYLRKK